MNRGLRASTGVLGVLLVGAVLVTAAVGAAVFTTAAFDVATPAGSGSSADSGSSVDSDRSADSDALGDSGSSADSGSSVDSDRSADSDAPDRPTLVVTDGSGAELVRVPVSTETEVVLEYTHSVERTLVRDVYVPTDCGLTMTRMEFSSFGAGLPSEAEVTERDGRYVTEPPRVEYRPLRVETGPIADHDLVVGDERYDLASMADGGTVELTVDRREGCR